MVLQRSLQHLVYNTKHDVIKIYSWLILSNNNYAISEIL